jgi:hypothetical protein
MVRANPLDVREATPAGQLAAQPLLGTRMPKVDEPDESFMVSREALIWSECQR